MGLPSKKQLHKHKRGTRKALDTLDAMEKSSDESKIDEEVEAIIEKKKKDSDKEQPVVEPKNESAEDEAKEETLEKELPIELPPAEPSEAIAMELPEEQVASQPDEMQDTEEPAPEIEISEPEIENHEEKPAETPSLTESNATQPDEQTRPLEGEKPLMDDSNNTDGTAVQAPGQSSKPKQSQQKSDDVQDLLDFDDGDVSLEDTQKDKYLTFNIGEEIYGVSIVFVTEIIVIQRITEVPDTPSFVKGVINLRGKVIPVIDIRQRFNLELREYDERTCIIVIDCMETSVGVIVDIVAEVVDIPENQVDPPPKSHSGIQSSYILGMGKSGMQVTIILDIEKVLFVEELMRRQQELYE